MVNIGTNNVGRCSHMVLEEKFTLLDKIFKTRTSKVAFSKVLPIPYTGSHRHKLRVLSVGEVMM